jgi:transcriptional regulator with XRE-family HTH domain
MSASNKQHIDELTKINKHISQKANELRVVNKISQSDVARYLDMSRNAVCEMMSGKSGFTPRTIYLLCYIFKCEVSDLFPPQGAWVVAEIKTKKVHGFQKSKLKIS